MHNDPRLAVAILGISAFATILAIPSTSTPIGAGALQGPSGRVDLTTAVGGALLEEPSAGGIVAIGGGKLPDRIYRRILQLTGRQDPQVLVLPLATAQPDVSGPKTEQRFRECGARQVDWKFFRREDGDKADVLDKIRKAHVIFFPGGDQKKILETVRGTGAARAFHDVLARGGVVGGTSAGCEVLGDLSLTGTARLDLAVVQATEVEAGLSLVPGVVFDQHFLRRGRFLRLLSATLDAPKKIGIGVDESTAAIFPHGTRSFEVVGERQVTVFRLDEDSKVAPGKAGELARASNLRLHVLAEGDRYDIDKNVATFGVKSVPAPAPVPAATVEDEPASRKAPVEVDAKTKESK